MRRKCIKFAAVALASVITVSQTAVCYAAENPEWIVKGVNVS